MNSKTGQRIIALTTLVTIAGAAEEAHAFRKFLNQFSEHYDANGIATQRLTDDTSCGLCHVRAGGGGRRTPYGEDFRNRALDEGLSFPAIEFVDSDADGFNNLEEIFLQAHPGAADTAPAQRIGLSLQGASTLVIDGLENCTELNLKAFGFTFSNGSSELTASTSTTPMELTLSGTQGAILARCDSQQAVGSLLVD